MSDKFDNGASTDVPVKMQCSSMFGKRCKGRRQGEVPDIIAGGIDDQTPHGGPTYRTILREYYANFYIFYVYPIHLLPFFALFVFKKRL